MADFINQKEYLTQGEVAERFRVTESTVKNWRDKGKLPYLLFPWARCPLYPKKEIEELVEQYATPVKEVVKKTNKHEIKRKKPEISSNPQKEWRI